jgi:hypothetical protein
MEMICSNSEDALRRGEIRKRTKMYATLLENAKEKNLVYAAQIYIDQYWFRELSDKHQKLASTSTLDVWKTS